MEQVGKTQKAGEENWLYNWVSQTIQTKKGPEFSRVSDKKVIRKKLFRVLHPDSNLKIAKLFTPDGERLPDSSVKTAEKYEENSLVEWQNAQWKQVTWNERLKFHCVLLYVSWNVCLKLY